MASSTAATKALAYGPAVVVSTVLTSTIGALLPGLVGLAGFVLGLAVMMSLLAGLGEGPALRLPFRARELTPAEQAALAPAMAMLCQSGIGPPAIRLWAQSSACRSLERQSRSAKRRRLHRAGERGPRRQVAPRPGRGGDSPRRRRRAQRCRALRRGTGVLDPAVAARVRSGSRGRPRPPLAAADRLGVEGALHRRRVALIQCTQSGYPLVGVGDAAIIALTYLVPRWERAWLARLSEVGDQHVRQAGLADALARFLRRGSGAVAAHERIHALTGPAQRPTSAVVAGAARAVAEAQKRRR